MMNFDEYILILKKYLAERGVFSIVSASFDITNECNLSCEHCYNKQNVHGLEMEGQHKHQAISVLSYLGVVDLVIGGGEPFLCGELHSVIMHAKTLGMRVTILSNGTVLNVDEIKRLNNCFTASDVLQVSVDDRLFKSVSKQRNHTNDQRDAIARNISHAVQNGIPLVVNITPTKINEAHILGMIDELLSMGVVNISATPYVPFGGVLADTLRPDYDRLFHVHKRITEYAEERNFNYSGGIEGHPCQNLSEAVDTSIIISPKYWGECEAAKFTVHVSADGKIYPCVFLVHPRYIVGHILDSPDEIKESIYKLRSALKQHPLPFKCQNCEALHLCGGGCPGVVLDRYNALDHVDPRCRRGKDND